MQVTNIKMKKTKKEKKKKKKKKAAEHYFHKIRSTFYMEITRHKLIFKTKDRVKT